MHSLGSCVLHLHINNKAYPTIFEVTNTTGPIILGRTQAKAMGYVQFPQVRQSHALITFPTALKKLCTIKTSAPETAPQNKFQRNTSKTIETDYRTSTTTNKMEHGLHRAQW